MNEAIVVRGLTKRYDGRAVVDGLDLTVRRGTIFGLLGANGAGKSTSIECMLGTRRADCGSVRLLGQSPDKNRRALCGQFGLGDKLNSPVKSLSGGQRQRLFIVLALIPQPELVFLDELTTGLDAKARREIWQLLGTLRDRGLTILLTSHFMDEVEALCDGICILRRGRTVFTGTVEEAKARCGCADFEDAYLMLSEDGEGE